MGVVVVGNRHAHRQTLERAGLRDAPPNVSPLSNVSFNAARGIPPRSRDWTGRWVPLAPLTRLGNFSYCQRKRTGG